MKQGVSRRAFLGGAASAFAVTFVPARVLGAEGPPPSDKLRIACVGCGGKGHGDVGDANRESIVALCDVDENRARDWFAKLPQARKFKDFRVMLQEMDKQIDAVTVSTPDHIHAPASMMAIKMGKHVFCQKPMAHSIFEARKVAEAAREKRVATQMGTQAHSSQEIRLVCEWVWAGALGPVREVQYWTNRPIWRQGVDRPKDTPPVPRNLDWDLWLGPAPERPYHPWYVPFAWRGWWDFGCGALGDIGCHAMDAAFWALKLGSPTSVEATSSPVNNETAPRWSDVTYQFPARPAPPNVDPGILVDGQLPPVKVVWHDGGRMPERPPELEPGRNLPGDIGGQLLIGDKGKLLAGIYADGPRLIPEAKMKEFRRPPQSIPRIPGNTGGHMGDWLRACKGGAPAGCNFPDYAGPLTEMVLLGNLAVRTGRRIEWDGPAMRCTNVPEANRYVQREYRKGWTL